MDLAAERHRSFSRARPGALAQGRSQSGRVPQAACRSSSSSGGRPRWPSTRELITRFAGWPSIFRTPTRGARSTPRSCGPGRSPIFPPSSGCTKACRSIRAAWACWPATTSKSASDLGIPLIGVGLLYAQGYFRQTLDSNGWQQELYLNADTDLLPIESVTGPDDQPLLVKIETTTGMLHARVWRVEVGRTMLLLLDSNVPQNSESDRSLTARLYGGDARVRIRQELLLGVGGLRALHALKVHPSVLHLNEGHSAFATLEMIRVVDGDHRPAVRRGRARRLGDDRLHDPYARGRRPRPVSRPRSSRSTWARSARRSTCRTTTSWGWDGSIRATPTSRSA